MSLERFQVPSDSSSTPQDHLCFYTPLCNRCNLPHIGLKYFTIQYFTTLHCTYGILCRKKLVALLSFYFLSYPISVIGKPCKVCIVLNSARSISPSNQSTCNILIVPSAHEGTTGVPLHELRKIFINIIVICI